MHRLVRLCTATLAALAVVGCGSKETAAPPSAAPHATAAPTAVTVTSAPPVGTPAPGSSVDPSAAPLPQAQVTNIRVTENAGRLMVTGTLLDAEKRPVIGAVGDFFLEGSAANLVQSYATKVDGSFSASFTTAEVPPEATLMMHYRGDTANAPGTFLLRRGVPRPATATPAATPATTPITPAAPPSATATPKPSTAARLVAFTDPDGAGQPTVTVTGPQARVTGRLITPADGHPVRNATITWKVGNDATGRATTAVDGAFEIVAELPEGAHQIVLQFAGTPDRAPATVTLNA